ncbi:MAG: glycosyl transferase family 90 [Rhizobiaceae bacterium]
MQKISRPARRVLYYARNVARDGLPQWLFRRQLPALLEKFARDPAPRIAARVRHYNRLATPFDVSREARPVGRLPMRKSYYYYDLKEHARYFDRACRLDFLFGDVVDIPPRPTLVKSRPIRGDNANSVLMNLDKLRHFKLGIVAEGRRFEDKKPMAVWRGDANNAKRHALVAAHAAGSGCDVGFTTGAVPAEQRKPRMSVSEQLDYRYVISVEGVDVATNLKWIMASNSLCLMPEPTCETWFMEGRLEPGVHYAVLRSDFADLEEVVGHYESHPEEARRIIANAQAHFSQFTDETSERLVSLLVLYKYLALSGQIDPDTRIMSQIA